MAYFRFNSTGSGQNWCSKANPIAQKSRFVINQGDVEFVKGIESKLTEAIGLWPRQRRLARRALASDEAFRPKASASALMRLARRALASERADGRDDLKLVAVGR